MPERIPPIVARLDDIEDAQRALSSDVRALTMAIRVAVAFLAGNGALNLADLLR